MVAYRGRVVTGEQIFHPPVDRGSGRAMAGLLAVFAEFEREILRERVHAGLTHARQPGKRLGRPPSEIQKAPEVRNLSAKASANPTSPSG
jgi:DNA invertase Pin-like site-specific DNA recombinase